MFTCICGKARKGCWVSLKREGEGERATACHYSSCDWQCVGEEVIAEVCLWWRGPSLERMLGRLRAALAESHGEPRTDDSSLTLHSLLFVYSSYLRRGALTDRELSPSDLAVLKDCGSSDLGTKQLSSIPQVHSPCKTTPQNWHVFTVSLQLNRILTSMLILAPNSQTLSSILFNITF